MRRHTTEAGEGQDAAGRDRPDDLPLPHGGVGETEEAGDMRDASGNLQGFCDWVLHSWARYSLYLSNSKQIFQAANSNETVSSPRFNPVCHPATMTLGQRLAALREARGEDQADVAAAVGVTRAQISHIEKDRRIPSTPLVIKLAKHFNVTESYLHHGVDAPANDDERFVEAFRQAPDELRTLVMSLLKFGTDRHR